MIGKLKAFLFRDAPEAHSDDEALRLATAVLLAEAALMDGTVGDAEQAQIKTLLARRFGLDDAAATALYETGLAEARRSTDLYSHARAVKNELSYDERVEMIEMLWDVAYADGELHDYEANLMRRLTGLLYVEERDSGEARKRVLERRRS